MLKVSNRFLFQLHGWFSLPVWLIFCFVCLTGTIAVISHEITWLTNSASRAANPNNLPAKNMPELIAIVEEANPTAKVSTALSLEPYMINAVIFTDTDKPMAIAYINQYTGEIQDINTGITFISFMRALHGWLLFPWESNYSIGYYIVCIMAIVMLGALITGLLVYKRFWRSFIQPKIRFTQGKKTLLADLHKLAGVWSIWFLMLMSITGLWYLTQAILWNNDYDLEPHPPTVNVSEVPINTAKVPTPSISLSKALAITQQEFPNFNNTYVLTPEHTRDTYKFYGSGDHIFYDEYSYGITISPWTGEVTSTRSPEKMTTLQTLSHIANPLHYGSIGGLWTKVIWFIFGLILTSMSITGFLMWGSRVIKNTKNTDELENSKELQ